MGIDIADACSGQRIAVDEMQDLDVSRHKRLREIGDGAEHRTTLLQMTESDFADDKRMCQNFAGGEMGGELAVARPQVVNPDGGVDQHHQRFRTGPVGAAAAP